MRAVMRTSSGPGPGGSRSLAESRELLTQVRELRLHLLLYRNGMSLVPGVWVSGTRQDSQIALLSQCLPDTCGSVPRGALCEVGAVRGDAIAYHTHFGHHRLPVQGKPTVRAACKNFSMMLSRHRLPFDRAFISSLKHVTCIRSYEWAEVLFLTPCPLVSNGINAFLGSLSHWENAFMVASTSAWLSTAWCPGYTKLHLQHKDTTGELRGLSQGQRPGPPRTPLLLGPTMAAMALPRSGLRWAPSWASAADPEANHNMALCDLCAHSRIYVCLYVYVYVCIHTYIQYIHACMHACMHACIHTYIYTYMHACMHTYMSISVGLSVCPSV